MGCKPRQPHCKKGLPPATYDTTAQVMAAIAVVRSVKLTIHYRCPIEDLDVPDVLEMLREDGAACVVTTEISAENEVQLVLLYQCDVEHLHVEEVLNRLREGAAAEIVSVRPCEESV
jgi:hypothetical protein